MQSDDAAVKRYGAKLATDMVRKLISSDIVPGIHFCTLNLEKSVGTILENLGWTAESNKVRSSPLPRHNQLIEDDTHAKNGLNAINGDKSPAKQMSGLSISPSEASQLAQWGLTNKSLPPAPKKGVGNSATSGSGPQGPSGEDSWDEYPNGRFTDVRSPAYGEIDGWGSGLKITVSLSMRCRAELLRLHKPCETGEHRPMLRNYPPFSHDISILTLPHRPHHFATFPFPPNHPPSSHISPT